MELKNIYAWYTICFVYIYRKDEEKTLDIKYILYIFYGYRRRRKLRISRSTLPVPMWQQAYPQAKLLEVH